MPTDLSNTLVIGISATALFDLRKEDEIFKKKKKDNPKRAVQEYRDHMIETEKDPLEMGTGFPLVKALLNLNQHKKEEDHLLVEVVVLSKNSPDTGVKILNNIRKKELSITRSAFTSGDSVVDYLQGFDVDLFLTTDVEDAQRVTDQKICAVAILKKPPKETSVANKDEVRIAFDGDGVLFDEESEIIYKKQGENAFHNHEDKTKEKPLNKGPYASLLAKLSQLQKKISTDLERSPLRLALITARNAPAELRPLKTLRLWDIYMDEAFFLGGVEKSKIVQAFKPHIFFDDQAINLKETSKNVNCAEVPCQSGSPLNNKK